MLKIFKDVLIVLKDNLRMLVDTSLDCFNEQGGGKHHPTFHFERTDYDLESKNYSCPSYGWYGYHQVPHKVRKRIWKAWILFRKL